jgi:hypothetical protein
LNHFVAAHEERLRDREPERLRGLEVDDQLELGRLLHGQVGGSGALEVLSTNRRALEATLGLLGMMANVFDSANRSLQEQDAD